MTWIAISVGLAAYLGDGLGVTTAVMALAWAAGDAS